MRFFLFQSIGITPLAQFFSVAIMAQLLTGLIMAFQSPNIRRVFVFGVCWLLGVLLPLAQQLSIALTGEGALFGRNGQGALMEPPVLERSLYGKVLVTTPQTFLDHASWMKKGAKKGLQLEYWCWNVPDSCFERVYFDWPDSENWVEVLKSSLRNTGCTGVADELEGF